VKVLDGCERLWDGPFAGIFFATDPVPAVQAYCEKNGVKFEDPDYNPSGTFPDSISTAASPLTAANRKTVPESLWSFQWPGGAEHDLAPPNGKWARFPDMEFQTRAPCVIDKMAITDVNQGGIDNCWLCAVVCAAINYAPDTVRCAVSPSAPNSSGVYSVKFWVEAPGMEGRWVYLPVDDRIFCHSNGGGGMVDMHSKQLHEMYVPLIAKAIGKWSTWYDLGGDERDIGPDGVNYRTIEEGCELLCFRSLTGERFSADLHWAAEADADYDNINRADALERVRGLFAQGIGAVCGGAEEDEMGLADSHSYTVLWHGTAAGTELVQLRNPWGEDGEWKGDWSDQSDLWESNPEVKQAIEELKSTSESRDNSRPFSDGGDNDGIFFMSLDDFVQHFAWMAHVSPTRTPVMDGGVHVCFPGKEE